MSHYFADLKLEHLTLIFVHSLFLNMILQYIDKTKINSENVDVF